MDHALQARRRARFWGHSSLSACRTGTDRHRNCRTRRWRRSECGPERRTQKIREITVLSNRADLISGGDALVAIDLGNADASAVKVTLNGKDITNAFAVRENGQYEGLVTGLAWARTCWLRALHRDDTTARASMRTRS